MTGKLQTFPLTLLLTLALTAQVLPQVRLADDTSLGKVAERDGAAFVKPVASERWVLACEGTRIDPGCWIKTAARGANALEVLLKDGSRLVLGPGTMAEVAAAVNVRLQTGDIEVKPAKGAKIQVIGPGGAAQEVSETRVLRVAAEKLSIVDKDPQWLLGFKAKSTAEAMGSLLATVDGRNVPLTIGYHKVAVDIRDQIARTEVEESFANHTDSVLEGVFYFPLPGDASISGFAMWIGNELVEADIVEKERAREIYETILAEKRDPGLLEWTGGNVFKARVYPIPANGEKRIRITYTQVLPKEGDAYRYSYALQSEMLKLHPLRELKVDVKVASVEALVSIACPSHLARVLKTDHAAQVEFAAQEYTPSRDFEIVVTTEPAKQGITVIPHVRDGEGYILALISAPPSPGDAAARTEPLDLILVADTSGSMTDEQLRDQRLFIASILESLGEKDRFQLLAFDMSAAWAFAGPVPPTAENREKAMRFLEKRGALGWTDLDLAIGEAAARASKGTQVIYVGDGILTKGDPDPAAFVTRIRKLYRGEGSFHAVALGSMHDLTVLRAIASLGAGSLHEVAGGNDAAQVASELLREITTSGLRDIRLEWNGIRVARVYPATLPNLPAGRQQIVLGRYLPDAKATKGTLRVTATAGGKPLAIDAPLDLTGAAEDNSFSPRLWARLHLDHLLAQGASPEVKENVIALSEEFQIITPYTSLLVLESDADRERFQVKRRFRMRGGEEFFAAGRASAEEEIARQQMLLAQKWRQGIREEVLRQYEGMGQEAVGLAPGPDGARYKRAIALSLSEPLVLGEPSPAAEEAVADEESGEGGEISRAEKDADLASDVVQPTFFYRSPSSEDAAANRIMPQRTRAVSAGKSFFGTPGLVAAYEYEGARNAPEPRNPETFSSPFPAPEAPMSRLAPNWPQEIRDVLAKLDRRDRIASLEGGLRITIESETIDLRGRTAPAERSTHLLAAREWASRMQEKPSEIPYLRWLRAGMRGTLDAARLLGGTRKSEDGDARSYPAPYAFFGGVEGTDPGNLVATLTRNGEKATLSFKSKFQDFETRYTLDVERNIILEVVNIHGGKQESSWTFSSFAEIRGALWPGKIDLRDGDGKLTRSARLTHEALAPDAFSRAMDEALASLPQSIILERPLPQVEAAKQRALEGKASFADRWMLRGYFAQSNRLEQIREHAAAAEALVAGKPGLDWLRIEALETLRRGEEAKQLLREMASRLAAKETGADFPIAFLLLQKASSNLQSLEQLELLQALRPVFERQDPRVFALKWWEDRRAGLLRELGRAEESFRALRGLVDKYPEDAQIQLEHLNALVERGEVDRGIEHIVQVLAMNGPWSESESLELRQRVSTILFEQRRLTELLVWVDRWDAEKEPHVSADDWNRCLSALVMLDREEEANDRIRLWVDAGRKADADSRAQARFDAALQHALGQGHEAASNRVDEQWIPLLVDLVRSFARDEKRFRIASEVLGSYRFRQTDEAMGLRQELYRGLAKDVDSLPAAVVESLFNTTSDYPPGKEDASRDAILQRVFARWEREVDGEAKSLLERMLLWHDVPDLALRVLRKQLERAKDDLEKATAEEQIFGILLARPWSREAEDELGQLIASGHAKPLERVRSIERMAHWLVEKLTAVEFEAIPDRSKKSARELKPLRAAARVKAQEAAVEALRKLEGTSLPADVLPFVRIERLTLEARLKKEPLRVTVELRSLFLEVPAADETSPLDQPRNVLAGRALLAMAFVATRPGAHASLSDSLLKLLDELIAKRDARKPERLDPREHKHWLLVALDRPDEIEAALAKWSADDGEIAGNRWRVPLGYILAERGKLAEAVKAFEGVEKSDELGAPEYRALAGWLLALGRSEQRREARIKAHWAQGEWEIASQLRNELSRFQRSGQGVPDELDEDVLLRFAALLRKASQLQGHVSLLHQFYETTKDFRLLEALPEAVIGQTAARIYPFLEGLSQILQLVGDEATVDRLEKHLQTRRGLTASFTDRRALYLLEFLVEKRAAAQANGGGPHAQAALAAMREAWKGEWADGEPVLMARLLASMAALAEPLRSEQLRQLQALHDAARPGSEDRFAIGSRRSSALYANGQRPLAIQVLDASLRERREAEGGLLPQSGDAERHTLTTWLEQAGEVREAEKLWRDELERDYPELRRRGFAIHLYHLYGRAIASGSRTSLGQDADLYHAVRDEVLKALEARTNEDHAVQLVEALRQVFSAARAKRIPDVGEDVRSFAFQTLPRTLALYNHRRADQMIQSASNAVQEALGPRDNLSFLIARAENEPIWLARRGLGFWPQQGHTLAYARQQTKDLGDLEPRLLALVLRQLHRDLVEAQQTTYPLTQMGSGQFWSEKREEFYGVAVKALEERRGSEEIVKHIAGYLYQGLGRYQQAIEALYVLERTSHLHEPGRWQLASWLLEQKRAVDAAPILASLIEQSPGNIDYRASLIRAHAQAGDLAKSHEVLKAADAYFRAEGRWSEQPASRLGFACSDAKLFEEAAAYLKEAIAMRLKASSRRGGSGDGTLSSYYASLAGTYSGLGKTTDAVDAASAAIVSWGRNKASRKQAEFALMKVLVDAKDLDAYAAQLDTDVAATHLENPTVRKALGRVYLDRKDFGRAIHQLEAAVEAGSADPDAQRSLIAAYDGSGDAAGAAMRLLSLSRKKPHDFALWKELGDRLKKLERDDESERAYTTLGEMSANESEGHAALAGVRMDQKRFAESADEWHQVLRVRSREPGGYIGLARALKSLGKTAEAREAVDFVLRQPWPARFGNVAEEARRVIELR